MVQNTEMPRYSLNGSILDFYHTYYIIFYGFKGCNVLPPLKIQRKFI